GITIANSFRFLYELHKRTLLRLWIKGPDSLINRLPLALSPSLSVFASHCPKKIHNPLFERERVTSKIQKEIACRWFRQSSQSLARFNRQNQFMNGSPLLTSLHLHPRLLPNPR